MASPFVEIIETQALPTAAIALYTSTGLTTRIESLSFCNTDTVNHTVTVYLVPAGGAASSSTITTSAQVLLPGQTWNSPNEYGHALNPGDSIWAFASAGSVVNIFGAGTQFS